jgi:hypothetical protein
MNKNIIARSMTTGVVNFKKIDVGKKKEKDFWFRLKPMSLFSISPKKFTG